MGLLDRYLRIRIVSAEPENLLTKLSFSNVELLDIVYIDLLTVETRIKKNQLSDLQRILQKSGATCHIIRKEGLLWGMQELLKRPVLTAGIVFFLFFSFILPGRIFFVEVVGNETVPDRMILAQAESCGIQFGVKASIVRSENIKNRLLSKLPQLQWLGITTSGTVATIQVKERSEPEDLSTQNNLVSSIVAARDGVITEMTVYKGNPLFQAGQSVKAGDILVSGYTDCGIKLKAENAQAEVFAYTLRQNRFHSPMPAGARGEYAGKHTCCRLRVGKKVINLCNHSGIQDATCVKMYAEDYWTLPGGFQLPVSVITVNYLFYEPLTVQNNGEEAFSWLQEFAREYLFDQMIAGEILDENLQWDTSDEGCVLIGSYACHEMIGQVKCEEIIEQNAQDN